jgi:hypothetical protein
MMVRVTTKSLTSDHTIDLEDIKDIAVNTVYNVACV